MRIVASLGGDGVSMSLSGIGLSEGDSSAAPVRLPEMKAKPRRVAKKDVEARIYRTPKHFTCRKGRAIDLQA